MKKENDFPQETPKKLAETDWTVFDKIRHFGYTENRIDVAPAEIRKEGDSSDLL